jgi:16S rRNA (guanine(527)-N(7))-methyltransferase RsmG
MHPDRIVELLEPFLGSVVPQIPCHSESGQRPGEEPAVIGPANDQRLTTTDLEHISTYIDILLRWNARINLTAIRDPEEIVTRHFGESFFAARHLFPDKINLVTAARACPEQAQRIEWRCSAKPSSAVPDNDAGELRGRAALQGRATDREEIGALAPAVTGPTTNETPERRMITAADIGSGAGFPGIPIKLWAPDISLTLIESNHKKATFLREIARALTLTNIDIKTARAESLSGEAFDLVTLRAVERFEMILPVAARLVAPGGRLALLIGSSQFDKARTELKDDLPTAFTWSDPQPIAASHSRILAIAYRSGDQRQPRRESTC